jgi:hypothetical protein
MKKILIGAVLALTATVCNSETIATMPNEAGGKIVLTDEICKYNGQVFDKLNRAYNYGASGSTGEGCWGVEDETVMVYWVDTNRKSRYPLVNFTINPNYSKKKNNRSM